MRNALGRMNHDPLKDHSRRHGDRHYRIYRRGRCEVLPGSKACRRADGMPNCGNGDRNMNRDYQQLMSSVALDPHKLARNSPALLLPDNNPERALQWQMLGVLGVHRRDGASSNNEVPDAAFKDHVRQPAAPDVMVSILRFGLLRCNGRRLLWVPEKA